MLGPPSAAPAAAPTAKIVIAILIAQRDTPTTVRRRRLERSAEVEGGAPERAAL
jgi:hypothetical protein